MKSKFHIVIFRRAIPLETTKEEKSISSIFQIFPDNQGGSFKTIKTNIKHYTEDE
ncbi:MAG: hypothetical protein J7L95_03685 [Prolixibacteraceae bacterium]|nr:hypothetical protein [Prolixibacteraceae bacterium]